MNNETPVMTDRPDLEERFRAITIRHNDGPKNATTDVTIQQVLAKFDTAKKRKDVLYALCLLAGINPMPHAKLAKKV